MGLSFSLWGGVLVKQEDQTQRPIYFSSHLLKDVETRYTPLEKLVLALTLIARLLRPYFLLYPIIVPTNSSLGRVLIKPDAMGCLIKWTIELSEYDIQYLSHAAIKAQTLANFLTKVIGRESLETWKIFVDGSATKKGKSGNIIVFPTWRHIAAGCEVEVLSHQ